jgi:uncharacterized membrane protein
MPPLAELHPAIVHFVIALGLVGIVLRVVSVVWSPVLVRHGATALILAAALASVPGAQSGHDAHGPAERIPGAREAVQVHESLGERSRNWLLALAALEMVLLVTGRRSAKAMRIGYAVSAFLGAHVAWLVHEAAEHGGELVYEYAGGVGTRRGDTADVQRLLVAGLFHQARAARTAKRHDEAARLTAELVRQRPDDPLVALLAIESRLVDERDAAGALGAIAALPAITDSTPPTLGARRAVLAAKAHATLGHADSARAVLAAAKTRWPQARSLPVALDSIAAWGSASAPAAPAATPATGSAT